MSAGVHVSIDIYQTFSRFCFRGNYVPLEMELQKGIIYIEKHITCWNIDSTFANNTGGKAGAFLVRYNVAVTNVNSTFSHGKGHWAGAIFGEYDIDIINTGSRFIG